MKKHLFILLLVTGISGAALACDKDKERKETTYQSNDQEEEAALAEPVAGSWQRTLSSQDFRQANYLRRDFRKSLFFSGDNARRLAGVEQVEAGALPARLKRRLRKTYKGYRIAQVMRYDDGASLYFVSLEKGQDRILLSCAR
jgi:hypothetical protein